jgi:hypothetical protein
VTLELAKQLRLKRCYLSLCLCNYNEVVDVCEDDVTSSVDEHTRVSLDRVTAYSSKVAGKLLVL